MLEIHITNKDGRANFEGFSNSPEKLKGIKKHHPLTAIVRNILSKFRICSGTFKFRINLKKSIRLNCASADHWVKAHVSKPLADKLTNQELSSKIYYLNCMKIAQAAKPEGLFHFASCFEKGIGVEKNQETAFTWFYKAAVDFNYLNAQIKIGVSYAKGNGVAKDDVKAFEFFKMAAEQGDAMMQTMVGLHYEKGKGVVKDKVMAIEWFMKAAEQGEAMSQFKIGHCYAYGKGVAKDEKLAVKWYEKAIAQNNANACVDLGLFHLYGIGVEKNAKHAVRLFRKAEIQEKPLAWYNLGVCYLLGVGVPQRKKKAEEYFKKSCSDKTLINLLNKSMPDSHIKKFNLGMVYAQGLGVPVDKILANEWLEKAAKEGNEYAAIAKASLA